MDNKCKEMTYQECIDDGWEMTADGFYRGKKVVEIKQKEEEIEE